MAKKVELKNRITGELQYPITSTSCVYDDKGKIISQSINQIETDISNLKGYFTEAPTGIFSVFMSDGEIPHWTSPGAMLNMFLQIGNGLKAEPANLPEGAVTLAVDPSLNKAAIIKHDIPEDTEKYTLSITESGTYHVVTNDSVNNLQIILPKMSTENSTYLSTCIVAFTTGDTPNVEITSEGNEISYFSGFLIEPNTTYELNFLFNGIKWITGYATVE